MFDMDREKFLSAMRESIKLYEGVEEYLGHEYFAEIRYSGRTHHMIIFDVLSPDSPVGDYGGRNRLYLSDEEYKDAVKQHKVGNIKIVSHAFALQGNLYYDKRDMPR